MDFYLIFSIAAIVTIVVLDCVGFADLFLRYIDELEQEVRISSDEI